SGSLDGVSGQIWRWARSGDFGLLTSQNLDNSDSLDHMVTYQILEAARESQITRYLLCWEDRTPSQASDFDFNDLVVEIEVSVAPIPEPSAFLTLCGLAAGTMFGSRRRR
ncbi:MAG: DUF4114 domain-containing protein, partial [Tepidisphaeraceae bacterium]